MHALSVRRRFSCAWSAAVVAAVLHVGPLKGADEIAQRAALDRLVGEWTGEVQVKAMDGFLLKAFPATRQAVWKDGVLVVETTFSDGSAEYRVEARYSIRLGRLESTVARPAQPEDQYVGELVSGALVWTNTEGNRRDAREITSERGGEWWAETTSVEPIRALGLSGLVRVEGRFRRPSSAPAMKTASADPAPFDREELVALQRALEEEKRISRDLRARLEEAERLVSAADARAVAEHTAELAQARDRAAASEADAAALREKLTVSELETARLQRLVDAAPDNQRSLESRIAALDAELLQLRGERDRAGTRISGLEQALAQAQRDNEQLAAANGRLEADRIAIETQVHDLQSRLAASQPAAPPPAPASEAPSVIGAARREQLIAELDQAERRVLELESERNAARESMELTQRQLEETRRLRDDTLLRFQTVVSELNAMREEKERLARANVSLQAEVRSAQQSARASSRTDAAPVVGPATPATTLDGKTADMIIAALQIIGVTRGETEDKVILDGRVYRNGDLIEAQLGIVFLRIDDNALVFQDRRGREYRRRF